MGPVIRNVIRDCIRPVMGDEALVSRYTAPVRDYFARLDAAGLRVTTYDKANAALIDRLVGNGGNFWPDSGAFCAMAGYLYPGNGANLIPLKDGHDAGTLNAFVTGDWNAVTGLKGDGSTKYVDSNRNNNSDGQDDVSWGIYFGGSATPLSGFESPIGVYIAGSRHNVLRTRDNGQTYAYNRSPNIQAFGSVGSLDVGLLSTSRDNASNFLAYNMTTGEETKTESSVAGSVDEYFIFGANNSGSLSGICAGRLPFYHIGPNLNGAGELAELDAALTEWKNALAAA